MKFFCLIGAVLLVSACSRDNQKQNFVSATFHAEELAPNHKVELSQRKVFPFSVVPGGTISKAEVLAMVAKDPIVREHYKGIDLDKLKPYCLTQPAQGYVSYRVGKRIYWTTRRLYLKAGEILLSDGVNVLRGRCGNRVSVEARLPALVASEPKEEVFDSPSWDTPVFQAMVRETNPGDSSLPLLLPGNRPQALISIYTDLLPEIFAVAPPVFPGMIGGKVSGPLPPSTGDSVVPIYNPPLSVSIAAQPLTVPPGIVLPSAISPPEFVRNVGPPGFTNAGPIGLGNPPLGFVGNLIVTGLLLPPRFVFPPAVTGGNPPIEVAVAIPIALPPGESNLPPDRPPTVNPNLLPPPETQAPQAFEPVPEPSTLWLVSAAAALLFLKWKR